MEYNNGLSNVEPTCIPGINPTWSWCMILYIYCKIQFNILLMIFTLMFIKDTDVPSFTYRSNLWVLFFS